MNEDELRKSFRELRLENSSLAKSLQELRADTDELINSVRSFLEDPRWREGLIRAGGGQDLKQLLESLSTVKHSQVHSTGRIGLSWVGAHRLCETKSWCTVPLWKPSELCFDEALDCKVTGCGAQSPFSAAIPDITCQCSSPFVHLEQAENVTERKASHPSLAVNGPCTIDDKPTKRPKALSQLVLRNAKWGRLLEDPDGLFTPDDVIDDSYQRFLADALRTMERHQCTFREALRRQDVTVSGLEILL